MGEASSDSYCLTASMLRSLLPPTLHAAARRTSRPPASTPPAIQADPPPSQVYKALLDETRPLAAKCIELGRSPTVQKPFLQEAEILWRLRHPNVRHRPGPAVLTAAGRHVLPMGCRRGTGQHTVLT